MTNEKLKEIKERLLEENDKRRRMEQEQANACANYYERGVNDALTAISFARPEQARPEQQTQPASKTRTNLDCIRTMSAEEIAEWAASHLECCSCPMSNDRGRACEKNCAATFIKWLNSPAKEGTE